MYVFHEETGLFVRDRFSAPFRQLTTPWKAPYLLDLAVTDSALLATVRDYFSQKVFWKSSDGGVTWKPAPTNLLSTEPRSIALWGERIFVARAVSGGLACSVDGGETWALRCPPLESAQ